MKILYLAATGQLGGAERSLLDMLASLRASQPDWPLLLIAGADGPLLAQARQLGVAAQVLPFPRRLAALGDFQYAEAAAGAGRLELGCALPAAARYALALRRAVSACAPDLVHSNGLKMHVLSSWAVARRTALLWHFHDYIGMRPRLLRLLRARGRACNAMIANSKSVAAEVGATLAPRRPPHLLYNCVDLENFHPDGPRLDLDTLAGLPPAPPATVRVGLVATMARWKGQEVFLRALAALPAQSPIRGYLIGGPIYQTSGSQYAIGELRALAAALGLTDKVGFTGFLDAPAAAMRALDVVVHASTRPEPFGLVIAEAMACGRAVIVSAAGGAVELIEPGHDALAQAPGDFRGLAAAISRLAADAELRARLGQAALQHARARFDRKQLGPRLASIYAEARSGDS